MSSVPGSRREIVIGGVSKEELLMRLRGRGVEFNEYAEMLFKCDAFTTSDTEYAVEIVEITAEDFGLPHGAILKEVLDKASALDLTLCPLELGPHLRLQYLDQSEGARGQPERLGQCPPGSLTIISEPVSVDDDFPRGFYLRRIHGVLWLRGYCSSESHFHSPDDRLLFRERF